MARSSDGAEFRDLGHDICEGIWIKRLVEELKFAQEAPICIYCDNKANKGHKGKINAGDMYSLPANKVNRYMVAKGLPNMQFDKLIDKLAMKDILKPA